MANDCPKSYPLPETKYKNLDSLPLADLKKYSDLIDRLNKQYMDVPDDVMSDLDKYTKHNQKFEDAMNKAFKENGWSVRAEITTKAAPSTECETDTKKQGTIRAPRPFTGM
ncbi:MAG: hypothetical protein K2Q32_00730 [Alphaproteobacteria bacterium]|nr:hypothetical protein [Alphaproteobacteria bacterium]